MEGEEREQPTEKKREEGINDALHCEQSRPLNLLPAQNNFASCCNRSGHQVEVRSLRRTLVSVEDCYYTILCGKGQSKDIWRQFLVQVGTLTKLEKVT
ncbi:hypothetical protein SORBI_3008G105366 [Sorghum bicolor]|uniref:Uncharacterized protein n=1 Tax=Sorghum bicolor TaxID=4558 RepID=A0A1Z5R740_SORBI|nr:hypothetical protein SORBI_3008G105366 [Sorghum bicolor]OQU79176.1 hypothetical protein SORBI_3008G105366 [Sorghum bicolor]